MFKHLINLFFPKVCAGCDAFLLTNENVICTSCRHNVPLTNHSFIAENEAFKKFYGKLPLVFVSTFVYFHKKGIVQQMIHNLKYKGCEGIGTAFGDWFCEDIRLLVESNAVDEIIPVPLHPRRFRERGYNQVSAFGTSLSTNLQINYNDQLLIRTSYAKTQTKKTFLGRTEVNKSSIFDVNFSESDHNKHFLLIDDVLTTGSTLEACGRALLKIPGAKISIVCIAMSNS